MEKIWPNWAISGCILHDEAQQTGREKISQEKDNNKSCYNFTKIVRKCGPTFIQCELLIMSISHCDNSYRPHLFPFLMLLLPSFAVRFCVFFGSLFFSFLFHFYSFICLQCIKMFVWCIVYVGQNEAHYLCWHWVPIFIHCMLSHFMLKNVYGIGSNFGILASLRFCMWDKYLFPLTRCLFICRGKKKTHTENQQKFAFMQCVRCLCLNVYATFSILVFLFFHIEFDGLWRFASVDWWYFTQ